MQVRSNRWEYPGVASEQGWGPEHFILQHDSLVGAVYFQCPAVQFILPTKGEPTSVWICLEPSDLPLWMLELMVLFAKAIHTKYPTPRVCTLLSLVIGGGQADFPFAARHIIGLETKRVFCMQVKIPKVGLGHHTPIDNYREIKFFDGGPTVYSRIHLPPDIKYAANYEGLMLQEGFETSQRLSTALQAKFPKSELESHEVYQSSEEKFQLLGSRKPLRLYIPRSYIIDEVPKTIHTLVKKHLVMQPRQDSRISSTRRKIYAFTADQPVEFP